MKNLKEFIAPIICVTIMILVLANINTITSFLSEYISSTPKIDIPKGNEYTKDYDFMFVQNSKDFIPYSESDLKNIIFSIINKGLEEFTFYCPSEYENCIDDITRLTSKDKTTATHINSYVHPYNSFKKLRASITDSGEITLYITYIYNENEINVVNNYADNLIKELYDKNDDDYAKIKKFHDYIINNTKYDVERNDKGDSPYKSFIAYGPVVDHMATCNGYSDLMAIILTKLGYQNFRVATTKDEISYESNGHIWNAVKINGKWLHLDLTWDDPVSNDGKDYLYHKYFLVTTEEMKTADSGEVNIEEHNFNKNYYQEFMNENNDNKNIKTNEKK